MLQSDKKGNWLPAKCFPCECGSDGIVATVETDKDYFKDCDGAPYINLAFWEFGKKFESNTLSLWDRIKYAWRILKGKSPWTDMVIMRKDVARNYAHHILYLLKNGKEVQKEEKPKVLVDWTNN